eukprot:CAMPEP_0196130544 /NCGR_PEP_ID=MMETSP0910-20130528/879_1 /TAXON_ID=49265 /ORGANISM="Thalassiosira rotula, Strain GSO102" /LENGTH=343 /DNA_ID=CAMNT_0041389877 /DNA_START=66 /DNA_END=1097 /DNA_ORIENTATION=+
MMFNQLTLATIAAFAIQSTGAESIYGIASSNDSFTTLAAAVQAAGLEETLSEAGTYTIFAPTNAAFADLPEGLVAKLLKPMWLPQLTDLLMYHALGTTVVSSALTTDGAMVETLNGEEVTINLDPVRVNDNTVIVPDVVADNGVIHGIDGVLVPTSVTSTIIDIGVASDDFSTLVAAVTAADLVQVLSGDGPFTLFAPTNDAFNALPEGTVTELLKDENKDKLIDILKYHVVSGNIPSSAVASGDVPTLNGDSFTVEVMENGSVMIDDATVTMPDVIASNGIIHVIDKVLMPPVDEAVPPADDTPATEDPAGEADLETDGSSAGASGLAVTAAIVAALAMVVA